MEIKNIYDRYPEMQVVFTRSSMLQIDNTLADLSRRCVFYDMYGMSFREYLEFYGIISVPRMSLEDLLGNHVKVALGIISQVKVLPLFQYDWMSWALSALTRLNGLNMSSECLPKW